MSKRVPISKDKVYRGGGGLYQGRVSITKVEALVSEYGPFLKITYNLPNGEEHWDRVSESKNLQPDSDGVGFEPAPGVEAGMDNHGADMADFIDCLIESGFPPAKLSKGDFTVIVGYDFNLTRKNSIDSRTGEPVISKVHVSKVTGKGYNVQHVVLDKCFGPTESKEGSAGDLEVESIEQTVADAIVKALKASPHGKLSKVIVRAAVNRAGGRDALKSLEDPKAMRQAAKIGKFIFTPDGGVSER